MAFTTPIDIANRGLQHCGAVRIVSFTDNSKNAVESAFAYDKLRRAELRAHIWRFSARRAPLRPITATSVTIVWPTWASGTAYAIGQIVQDPTAGTGLNMLFICVVANTGNTPSTSPYYWQPYFGPLAADAYSSTNTYSIGELVTSGGSLYISLVNGNINNTPSGGPPNWQVQTGATTNTLFIPYPITQTSAGTTRTPYRLPNGYMRVASQDVKTAGVSVLNTSAGMQWTDFEFEGNYLLTSYAPAVATNGPLVFRFCADVSDVTQFDDLFCEALGARLGLELCEPLTQSKDKIETIGQAYASFVGMARKINSIERGSTEPGEDDYDPNRIPDQRQAAPQRGAAR